MANETYIQKFRRETGEAYSDLTDFQIADAVHKKYQAETGATVDLPTFAQEMGVSLETKPLDLDQNGMVPRGTTENQPVSEDIQAQAQGSQVFKGVVEALRSFPDVFSATAEGAKVAQAISDPRPSPGFGLAGSESVLGSLVGENLYQREQERQVHPFKLEAPETLYASPEEMLQTDWAQEAIGNYQAISKEIQARRPTDPAGKLAFDVVTMAEKMVPAIAAGAVTKSPNVGLGIMYAQVYADRAGQLAAEGVNPKDIPYHATASAIVETATEKLPFDILLSRVGWSGVKKILGFTVAEGLQEGASGLLQGLYDKGTLRPDLTMGEILRDAGYETLIGTLGAPLIGGPAVLAQQMIGPSAEQQAFDDLVDSIMTDSQIDPMDMALRALSPENAQLRQILTPKETAPETVPAEELPVEEIEITAPAEQTEGPAEAPAKPILTDLSTGEALERVNAGEQVALSIKDAEKLVQEDVIIEQPVVDKLAKEIQEEGLKEPIELEEKDGKIEIADGHHRIAAMKQLGETQIPVKIEQDYFEAGMHPRLQEQLGKAEAVPTGVQERTPVAPTPEKVEDQQLDEISNKIQKAEESGVILSEKDKKIIRETFNRANELIAKANRLGTVDPMGKGTAFPMGVGYTKMTKRKSQAIDASVRRAGEAVKLYNKAESAENYANALLTGKGTEADLAQKAKKRSVGQENIVRKLLNWKKGDKIGGVEVVRINKNRDGYPVSYTIKGEGILKGVMDKVNIVKELFDGDTEGYHALVDEIRAETPKKKAVTPEKPVEQPKKEAVIEDFGEKIGGARKDVYGQYKEKISVDITDEDIISQPLSKIFPEPEYQKLLESGADQDALILVRAMRSLIPAKGRKRYKQQQYVEQVKLIRDFTNKIVSGEVPVKWVFDKMEEGGYSYRNLKSVLEQQYKILKDINFPEIMADTRPYRIAVGRYSMYQGKEYDPPIVRYIVVKNGRDIGSAENREGAIEILKDHLVQQTKKGKQSQFDVYRRRGEAPGWIVGKKVGRNYIDLKTDFQTSQEALAYAEENNAELVELLKKKKAIPEHRRPLNEERLGKDYREGKDVRPEQFGETFMFRGVEFGNWVEQDRRQQDLNDAYDALMDLANLLHIPPSALSLGGQLGLAFGARGKGGKHAALAHYESDKVVINLTKKAGPGSLAHEWWHGLDNYFSRKGGAKYGFVTEGKGRKEIRQEMFDAFQAVNKAIAKTAMPGRAELLDSRRTKDYWTTRPELSARSFENYVIQRLSDSGFTNDYLANIVNFEAYAEPDAYPYLKSDEVEIVGKAFDDFFQTIKVKEGPGPAILYANPAEVIYDAYQRNADKALNWMNDAFGWRYSVLGKLPSQKLYLATRYRTLGRIANVDSVASKIYETFAESSQRDQVAVYDYLTTREASSSAIRNETTRNRAIAVKRLIGRVGRALVDRGLLSPEAYEAHRDAYLPRLYLKHLLDEKVWKALGSGKTVSDMGYLKQRKDIPKDVREVLLGEITDPGYLASKGVGRAMRDMAILDLLDTVSAYNEWVWAPSMVQWQDRNVSVYWLAEEAARVRKQIPYYTDENKAKAEKIVKEMDAIIDPALEEAGKAPDDFVQIPTTARYGRLAGMYLRKEIYNDLFGAGTGFSPQASVAERILGYGGWGTKVTQLWKMSKVALNPPTQIRNFVSNGILLHLSGVPFHRVPQRVTQAIHEIATNGKHFRIAKKWGITESTFTANELIRIEREIVNLEARHAGRLSMAQLKEIAAIVADAAGDMYQLSEQIHKTAKIIDAMEREGMSEADATMEAQKWLYDYSLIPPTVRYLRNAPVGVPFLTFYYKTAPRMLETLIKHPGRFAPYALIPMALAAMIADDYDVDEEDLKALKKALPIWLQERGNAWILPYKDQHGRWQVADIGYFLPWAMFTEAAKEAAEGDVGGVIQTTGLLGGPIPDMIAATKTGMDSFFNQEIYRDEDPPAKQAADVMLYLWRLSMPTFLTDKGATGHVYAALTEQVDRKGDPKLTLSQAAMRLAGVNIYPIEPQKSRRQNLSRMNFELKEITRRMGSRLRDKNLSPEDKAKLRADYRKLIKDQQERIKEYRDESKVHPNLR